MSIKYIYAFDICDFCRQWSVDIIIQFDTTLCDKVRQLLATGRFSSSTNKTDRHDIIDILLKVALNTIDQTYCSA